MVVVSGNIINEDGSMGKFSGSVDTIPYGSSVIVKHNKKVYSFKQEVNGKVRVW